MGLMEASMEGLLSIMSSRPSRLPVRRTDGSKVFLEGLPEQSGRHRASGDRVPPVQAHLWLYERR